MRRTAWIAMLAMAWMVPSVAAAQQAGNPNDPWCARDGDRDRGHYCEVREMTLPAPGGVLTVNARPNGGIKIVGSDRRDVQVRAKVVANADTDDEAKALAGQVRVQTAGTIQSEGPSSEHDRSWSVSYEIAVPSGQGLSLASINGGISIQNIQAQVDFETRNGGVVLTDVAGAFKGRTQNGGVQVSLRGQRWEGQGLDVETQNGGIRVSLPEGYSARLETSTVNGGVRTDLPVTATGTIDRRHLHGDLNAGGPTLRLVTTNGGVSITKK